MISRRTLLAAGSAAVAYSSLSPCGGEERRAAKLLLYGGGRPYEPSVLNAFFRLAGGGGSKFVVIPTAHTEMDHASTRARRLDLVSHPWRERGAKQVEAMHTLDRRTADAPDFLQPLREADAVWFGGGDQSRLLATYHGTRFHRLLIERFQEGCAVGGSSAGTAVQSKWTITDSHDDRPVLEAGFGLLVGAIVDQHFLTRKREPRLRLAVKSREPQFGLGVDEYTAAHFSEGKLTAVGKSTLTLISPDGIARTLREGESLDSAPLGLL